MSAAPTAIPERVAEAAIVLAWLERNPTEFDTILVLAGMEEEARGLSFAASTAAEERRLASRKRSVERYFGSAMFGACASCYVPVVSFSDGRAIHWPEMGEHIHELMLAEEAVPRRARAIAS